MAPRVDNKASVEVGFPFQIDNYGRVADPGYEVHVQQMIELVLFTAPGERVNRPDFGCGLLQLIQEPEGSSVATATEYVVQTALQKWLGDVISVRKVEVKTVDASIQVTLSYMLLRDRQLRVAVFEPRGGSWGR